MSTGWDMSEGVLQDSILDLAKRRGWLRMHVRPAINRSGKWSTPTQGDAGYPDLTLVHPASGLVFAELKDAKGKLSDDQARWRDALLAAGLRWFLWRPADWLSGGIAAALDPSAHRHEEAS